MPINKELLSGLFEKAKESGFENFREEAINSTPDFDKKNFCR